MKFISSRKFGVSHALPLALASSGHQRIFPPKRGTTGVPVLKRVAAQETLKLLPNDRTLNPCFLETALALIPAKMWKLPPCTRMITIATCIIQARRLLLRPKRANPNWKNLPLCSDEIALRNLVHSKMESWWSTHSLKFDQLLEKVVWIQSPIWNCNLRFDATINLNYY